MSKLTDRIVKLFRDLDSKASSVVENDPIGMAVDYAEVVASVYYYKLKNIVKSRGGR